MTESDIVKLARKVCDARMAADEYASMTDDRVIKFSATRQKELDDVVEEAIVELCHAVQWF